MTSPTIRLRIDEVAKLAGVSAATVSRVLSGSQKVSIATRERVLAVVTRFGYQPSRLAKNLRNGRADVVGVVVSDIENPHFATMVRAIEDAVAVPVALVVFLALRQRRARLAAEAARSRARLPSKRGPSRPPKGTRRR